ncbi:MAG: MFS transporter [Oscillospiraceae bacterium]|nr:MFS transporter [Oscillospiraceae bacterium]
MKNTLKPLIEPLKSLKGNAFACVVVEPLFTVPRNIYLIYLSLFMLSQGMTKNQIGLVTSMGLAANMIVACCSPYLTDRFGRKNATLYFGLIGWTAPLIIWSFATNINYFIIGTLFNSFGYVTMNSTQCLMIEDSKPSDRIHFFNLMQVSTISAGFFAPLGGFLIRKYEIVVAMRIILVATAVLMSTQFFVRHVMVTETETGKIKKQQMKGTSLSVVLKDYLSILRRITSDKLLVIAILLRAINFIQLMMKNTYLAVLITERLGFSADTMALYQTLSAVIMLVVLLGITPFLSKITKRWPIALGVAFHITATTLLLISPPTGNYLLLIITAVCDAFGTAITTPRIDTLTTNTIVNQERTVANSVMHVMMLVLSIPFGYLGGMLSDIDTRLPFVMVFILFICCFVILHVFSRASKDNKLSVTPG